MNKIIFSGLLILVCCLAGDVGTVNGATDISGQCVKMTIPANTRITPNDVCRAAGHGPCIKASGYFYVCNNELCAVCSGAVGGTTCSKQSNSISPFDRKGARVGNLVYDVRSWGAFPAPKNVPKDLRQAVANATNWLLGFVSMIAVLVVIWGGINYLTAAGDEDRVKTAKRIIKYGLMGVVIAGFAYAIVTVIAMILN